MSEDLVLGIDVGTSGVRAVAVDAHGSSIASACVDGAFADASGAADGRHEQDPEGWWSATVDCLSSLAERMRADGCDPESITAACVASTSGTVLALDGEGSPLRSAIMYSDVRAKQEAAACNDAGKALVKSLGYRFSPSFSLPKVLWLKNHEPEVYEAARFCHPADFIAGRLCGDFDSDTSNALKTGYDLVNLRWPAFLGRKLSIDTAKLPSVGVPGTPTVPLRKSVAAATGLSARTMLTRGLTDGTAAFVSGGAADVGEWVSSLGTTLVVKGISQEIIKDPQGRLYSHRHPDGMWLPGGASSVGGECLAAKFPPEALGAWDGPALARTPTGLIVYPLVRKGERLPFHAPEAEGFAIGKPPDEQTNYAAYMEGVGFVEKWIFDLLEELGASVGDTVFAVGGGAKSGEWLQIRANILNRALVRPAGEVSSAMGAAVVAASHTIYDSLSEATRNMVHPGLRVEPEKEKVEVYRGLYRRFRRACAVVGYE